MLYVGTNSKLIKSIASAYNPSGSYNTATNPTDAHVLLKEAEGIVVVGGYKEIFYTSSNYLHFLNEVITRQNKKIARVTAGVQSLPGDEFIDKVIESEDNIELIVSELHEFFDNNH